MKKIKAKGSELSLARITAGMTSVDLAKKAGISKQFMYQIEGERENPGPATAKKIIEVLGVRFEQVFHVVDEG